MILDIILGVTGVLSILMMLDILVLRRLRLKRLFGKRYLKGVIARGDRGIAGDVTVSRNMSDSDRGRMAINIAAKDDTFLVWVETPEEASAWKSDEWVRTGRWELDDMLWDDVIVITAGQLRSLLWNRQDLLEIASPAIEETKKP